VNRLAAPADHDRRAAAPWRRRAAGCDPRPRRRRNSGRRRGRAPGSAPSCRCRPPASAGRLGGPDVGGEGRNRCSAPQRELVAVEHCAELPGLTVKQQVAGADGRQVCAGIGGVVGHRLHPEHLAVHPGGHHQQRTCPAVRQADVMDFSLRHRGVAVDQQALDCLHQLVPRRGLLHRRRVERQHQPAAAAGPPQTTRGNCFCLSMKGSVSTVAACGVQSWSCRRTVLASQSSPGSDWSKRT